MMLTTDIMYKAGLYLTALTCWNEHDEPDDKENANLKLPEACTGGSDNFVDEDIVHWLESVITPEMKLELVATIAYMAGQCTHAWKYDIGLVFHHMGLESDKDLADALYYLLMGCFGHGVSLEDFSYERGDLLEKVEKKLGSIVPKTFDPAPCHFDQHEQLYNIAAEKMESRGK